MRLDGRAMALDLRNTGDYCLRVEPQLAVLGAAGDVLARVVGRKETLLPGERVDAYVALKELLPEGEHTVLVTLMSGSSPVATQEVPLNREEPATP